MPSSYSRPLSLSDSGRRHWEIDTRQRIVIRNLPTDAPFSILTNAVGLFVSLPLRWSLKFVVMQDGSEHIELYDYIHEARIGRIRLVAQRNWLALCKGWGFLEFVKGSKQIDAISSIEDILNNSVKKDPLQILNINGKVVEAARMNFVVEIQAVSNNENERPYNVQQCQKRLEQTSGDGRATLGTHSTNESSLPGKA
jgi:hypothetical protein